MTNQISASRALSTLKTLSTNIGNQISSSKFSFIKKGNKNLETGKSVKDSIVEVENSFKSVKDKIDESFRLRQGLNEVNYSNEIQISGKTLSILDALTYKHYIIPQLKTLLQQMKIEQSRLINQYKNEIVNHEKRLTDAKDNEALLNVIKSEEPAIHDVSDKVNTLQKEIEDFEMNFDILLNELNPGLKFNL